jgi:glycosyltransferase involved in cell wall biosynthesis
MIEIIAIILSFFVFYSTFIILMNLFWNYSSCKEIKNNNLSILIPARNEEKNIQNCINSIIKTNNNYKEILIYDDHSTDSTAKKIKEIIQTNKKVKIAKTLKLEKGWTGKSFACYQLAKQSSSEWIVFLDADTTIFEDLSQLIDYSKANNLSMLSAWPKIEMQSFVEKIFMPLLNFIVYTTCPMFIAKKRSSDNLGLAHGACILFRKKIYMNLGGHNLVKNDLFEDTRLARKWRLKGEKTYCINGSKILSVKMYDSFSAIWNGFKKNYYPSFNKDLSFFVFQSIFITSYILAPIMYSVLIILNLNKDLAIYLLILNFVPRILINLKFKYNFFLIFTQPIGIVAMFILGLDSWKNMKFGKGLSWKDRIYEKS